MKIRRILALSLVAIMLVAVFASCAKPMVETKVKIKIAAGADVICEDNELAVSHAEGADFTVVDVINAAQEKYKFDLGDYGEDGNVSYIGNYLDGDYTADGEEYIEEDAEEGENNFGRYFWQFTINDKEVKGSAKDNVVNEGDLVDFKFYVIEFVDGKSDGKSKEYDSNSCVFNDPITDEEDTEEE